MRISDWSSDVCSSDLGQRRVVGHLCQGAGAATVVVGVAGSGKTTALDAASTALESAGSRVLGPSTSWQAAWTLGRDADLESRTDRKRVVSGNSMSIRVDPGGRRIIKKIKTNTD